MTIPLPTVLPRRSSCQPGPLGRWRPCGRYRFPDRPPREAPIWHCSGWGLPCRPCRQVRGGLLPHRFTLTPSSRRRTFAHGRGSLFSVALSLGLPPPGVTRHPCQRESGLSSEVTPRGHPALRARPVLDSPLQQVNGNRRPPSDWRPHPPSPMRSRPKTSASMPTGTDTAKSANSGNTNSPLRNPRTSISADAGSTRINPLAVPGMTEPVRKLCARCGTSALNPIATATPPASCAASGLPDHTQMPSADISRVRTPTARRNR
jgi:hypothetical protein